MCDANKVIDIGEWLICGGGRLERFYCSSGAHVPGCTLVLRTHWFGINIPFYTQSISSLAG